MPLEKPTVEKRKWEPPEFKRDLIIPERVTLKEPDLPKPPKLAGTEEYNEEDMASYHELLREAPGSTPFKESQAKAVSSIRENLERIRKEGETDIFAKGKLAGLEKQLRRAEAGKPLMLFDVDEGGGASSVPSEAAEAEHLRLSGMARKYNSLLGAPSPELDNAKKELEKAADGHLRVLQEEGARWEFTAVPNPYDNGLAYLKNVVTAVREGRPVGVISDSGTRVEVGGKETRVFRLSEEYSRKSEEMLELMGRSGFHAESHLGGKMTDKEIHLSGYTKRLLPLLKNSNVPLKNILFLKTDENGIVKDVLKKVTVAGEEFNFGSGLGKKKYVIVDASEAVEKYARTRGVSLDRDRIIPITDHDLLKLLRTGTEKIETRSGGFYNDMEDWGVASSGYRGKELAGAAANAIRSLKKGEGAGIHIGLAGIEGAAHESQHAKSAPLPGAKPDGETHGYPPKFWERLTNHELKEDVEGEHPFDEALAAYTESEARLHDKDYWGGEGPQKLEESFVRTMKELSMKVGKSHTYTELMRFYTNPELPKSAEAFLGELEKKAEATAEKKRTLLPSLKERLGGIADERVMRLAKEYPSTGILLSGLKNMVGERAVREMIENTPDDGALLKKINALHTAVIPIAASSFTAAKEAGMSRQESLGIMQGVGAQFAENHSTGEIDYYKLHNDAVNYMNTLASADGRRRYIEKLKR